MRQQQTTVAAPVGSIGNSDTGPAAEQQHIPVMGSQRGTETAHRVNPSPAVPSVSSAYAQDTIAAARPKVPNQGVRGRRVGNPSTREQRKTSVYIGLDFGTTFTKAAYEIAPSNVHTKYSVRFGDRGVQEDYYLPSVVYFNPDTEELSIFDETGKREIIRYFKYSMISDALKKNETLNRSGLTTQTPKEQLCCVFFLSYVISFIRDEISRKFGSNLINDSTAWYINMGVPLEAQKDDQRALLYKRVLEIASLLEAGHHGTERISIHELDDFFVANRNTSNPNINILPEIYAEVLLYQQYLNTPAGFYTVVDIGGGTEDIATFLKTTDSFGEKVECIAQNVIGYGFDSIAERIVRTIEPVSIAAARIFLNMPQIDYNNDESVRSSLSPALAFEKVIAARLECRKLFGTCIQKASRTRVEELQKTIDSRLPMYVFVMGGARNVAFYRAAIEFMEKVQINAGVIPFFRDADVFDYVGRNTHLEIRYDQRLIISQMLAQPYELIPEIENMPWDLKESDITSKAPSWLDLQERLHNMYSD